MHIGHEREKELSGVGEARKLTRTVGSGEGRVELWRDVLGVHCILVLKCDAAPCKMKTHREHETNKYTNPNKDW